MRLNWRARLAAGLFSALFVLDSAHAAPAATVAGACEKIGARLQSVGVKTCLRANFSLSGATSMRGVPLLYRDFVPRGAKDKDEPKRVLMIGGIHGDELTAVSLAFRWMQKLEETEFNQPFRWRVAPSVNPDGLLAKPSTRGNANGVDLNRNFATDDWSENALEYWKKRTGADPRRYPGKKAASESETRWLTEQIKSFHPDAIVSIHAPYGVLDYDGPDNPNPPQRFGYLRLQRLGVYPGSLGNYGYSLGIPVITLELPSAGNMPTQVQTQKIWSDMISWLEKNLSQIATAPLPPRTLREP